MDTPLDQQLKTPLYDLHVELGGRMVAFAGYSLPVQYPAGIMKEHLHTRTQAGLFDVSHMGQIRLHGHNVARELEALVPGDLQSVGLGRMRYTLFTAPNGGILDDLMVTNAGDYLFVVVNAARKAHDLAHLRKSLPTSIQIEYLEDRALLALQGPAAGAVMARLAPETELLTFMSGRETTLGGVPVFVTRSGYTGEDGFEISIPGDRAVEVARLLLAQPGVQPVGLGARDSLRLEAGLCLYGHDIDETTNPIEGNLSWAIGKRRRAEGGFPGSDVILKQLENGSARRLRVGFRLEGRQPAREGSLITDMNGMTIGHVTSGGFGPSVDAPVAIGYVDTAHAAEDTPVQIVVRGKPLGARVAPMPFTPHRYKRG